MDGSTPKPSPSDGLDETFAALGAIRGADTCPRYFGTLRANFGACGANQDSATSSVAATKQDPAMSRPSILAVSP